ncbi:MAG: type II toxin-antitoxin system prevent-host-death family antitoxin [Gammaproteobacteria bacterium TMED1]|nr:MAG: type II toxin-antitoxin system prevent-host-death family antitoxin [Gammaproteobacteria bacterium TMED1]|tara:strand:+ start:184 stop:438 length:255 start_codon:yes stop_codon:yes gene_type:complete
MRIVTYSEARNNLKRVLDQVIIDSDFTIISRRNADDMAVLSLEQFNGLMETVNLLKYPVNASHLNEAVSQYNQRQTLENGLVDD